MRKKILYIFGGFYTPNGMASIISEKVNYLAENTDYEMYMVLTEIQDKPEFYQLSENTFCTYVLQEDRKAIFANKG